ncbi:MAG: oligoribonuclease [Bdellovibrionales bacterium]|nr:oligoribonuclease [Bdellovibrionales bacterium]
MTNLLWVDLEMTGLQVERDVVIEVAALVTDLNFNELTCYEAVVKQSQTALEQMDSWNQEHHKASGLLAKIPSGKDPLLVERELVELTKRHFPDPKSKPVLAGNSISQDRAFIDRYFKNLAGLLHYRMLDVTAWKIIFQNKYKKEFKKKQAHRALDDIRESIEELKFYLSFVKPD